MREETPVGANLQFVPVQLSPKNCLHNSNLPEIARDPLLRVASYVNKHPENKNCKIKVPKLRIILSSLYSEYI